MWQHLHLNLLISKDKEQIKDNLEIHQEPETDLQTIQVIDDYSKIKQSIKNILINRCSVKLEELHQFCQFQLEPPTAPLARQSTEKEAAEKVLEAAPALEKSKTLMPAASDDL